MILDKPVLDIRILDNIITNDEQVNEVKRKKKDCTRKII